MISYLSKKRMKDHDVDNFPKHFCDILKEFTGDDSLIQLIISEKRELDIKDIQSNLCEEFLIFITHESFRKYLFAYWKSDH